MFENIAYSDAYRHLLYTCVNLYTFVVVDTRGGVLYDQKQ